MSAGQTRPEAAAMACMLPIAIRLLAAKSALGRSLRIRSAAAVNPFSTRKLP